MAEITAITPQIHDKTRCNIEVDGRFFCGMKLVTVIQNRLKVGSIVTAESLAKMQLEEKAYSEPQDIRDPDLLYENLKDDEDYLLLKRLSEPGATIASVAAELGIGVSACSKRIQRARKRLRKFF